MDLGSGESEVHARSIGARTRCGHDAGVDYGGRKPVRSKADADYFVQWIDRTLERAMQLSFNNETERNAVRKLYEEARAKMVQRAAEAQ
jgi:hypothetical protein